VISTDEGIVEYTERKKKGKRGARLTPTVATGRKNIVTVATVSILKLSFNITLLSLAVTRLNAYRHP
jgi:hypothetical protein